MGGGCDAALTSGRIWSQAPIELRQLLARVDKEYLDPTDGDKMSTVSDGLFLLSTWEVTGVTPYKEGEQYAFWRNRAGTNAGSSAAPNRNLLSPKIGGGTTGMTFRTVGTSADTSVVYYVHVNGFVTGARCWNEWDGILPAFCL